MMKSIIQFGEVYETNLSRILLSGSSKVVFLQPNSNWMFHVFFDRLDEKYTRWSPLCILTKLPKLAKLISTRKILDSLV